MRASALLFLTISAGCGGKATSTTPDEPDVPGDGSAPVLPLVGSACTPLSETSASFGGFSAGQVDLDTGNPGCGLASHCLVNHFQGLTTCPYGQDASGQPNGPGAACTVPGTGQPVQPDDPTTGQTVQPQCADRRAADTVYCSCRCANAAQRTDDGADYCTCPGGFTCTELITDIGVGDPNSGAYCIKAGTAYDPQTSCASVCDPSTNDCL